MKTLKYKLLVTIGIIAASLLISNKGICQDRKLPDGTIVYADGTRRLPNGTVIYKGGTIGKTGNNVMLPDGTVIYSDGSRRSAKIHKNKSYKSAKGLSPGQAKKIYGAKSAREFAPGQQKKEKQGNGKGH